MLLLNPIRLHVVESRVQFTGIGVVDLRQLGIPLLLESSHAGLVGVL